MTRVSCQRALEALRNGVPNADAVRALGCMQPEALERFCNQLDRMKVDSGDSDPPIVGGLLISGGFGSGKSHTLSHFELEALKNNFIVSRVVISKETPLHDASKLFQAAVRNAKLPECRGSLLAELAGRIDYRTPNGAAFLDWVQHRQSHQMLAASVVIHEQSRDSDRVDPIVNWWAGEKLDVKHVRDGLKDLELRSSFVVKAIKLADLAPVRFEFTSRLARAVGFSGWVLLLDEVELISRYSLLQRARSYAELARWMGVVPEIAVPGISAVAAITDDFDIEVLMNKKDRDNAPARLQQKGDQSSMDQAERARLAIELIAEAPVRLRVPNDDTLNASFQKLASIYEQAFSHRSVNATPTLDGMRSKPMRSYVRRWINEWDLDRLYGELKHDMIEEESESTNYAEDSDFESDEQLGQLA